MGREIRCPMSCERLCIATLVVLCTNVDQVQSSPSRSGKHTEECSYESIFLSLKLIDYNTASTGTTGSSLGMESRMEDVEHVFHQS